MGHDLTVPNWWEAVLLALAAYRSWHLLVDDKFPVVDHLRRRLLRLGDWQEDDKQPLPSGYRTGLAEFMNCIWCFGFWNIIAWWVLWLVFPTFALFVAFPFAASLVLAAIKITLEPED